MLSQSYCSNIARHTAQACVCDYESLKNKLLSRFDYYHYGRQCIIQLLRGDVTYSKLIPTPCAPCQAPPATVNKDSPSTAGEAQVNSTGEKTPPTAVR